FAPYRRFPRSARERIPSDRPARVAEQGPYPHARRAARHFHCTSAPGPPERHAKLSAVARLSRTVRTLWRPDLFRHLRISHHRSATTRTHQDRLDLAPTVLSPSRVQNLPSCLRLHGGHRGPEPPLLDRPQSPRLAVCDYLHEQLQSASLLVRRPSVVAFRRRAVLSPLARCTRAVGRSSGCAGGRRRDSFESARPRVRLVFRTGLAWRYRRDLPNDC